MEQIVMDYFNVDMPENDIKKISNLGLAHIGDAVYELMVRTWLCMHGKATSKGLHQATVKYVSAPSQATAVSKIISEFSEHELEIYKRGRNAHVNSVPSRATLEEYHMATGLEALFGYLYLMGSTERLDQLFEKIMEE
jgi:ribonuclease-3 family protein